MVMIASLRVSYFYGFLYKNTCVLHILSKFMVNYLGMIYQTFNSVCNRLMFAGGFRIYAVICLKLFASWLVRKSIRFK